MVRAEGVNCNPTKCGCNTWGDDGNLTMADVERRRSDLGGGGGGGDDGGCAGSSGVDSASEAHC